MEANEIIILIEQFGYLALFFCLWMGIVGMPIPDELIVMTGGVVVSSGLLEPIQAFVVTYLGVVSGLTIGYIFGRMLGAPILQKAKLKKMSRSIKKSSDLINNYGSLALILSYFLPVVRHVVPYLIGINEISFRKYVMYSYSTGLVWTFIYFQLGRYFGNYSEHIIDLTYKYGFWFIIIITIFFIRYRFYLGENRNAKRTDFSN